MTLSTVLRLICVIGLLKRDMVMPSKPFQWEAYLSRRAAILIPCANRPDGRYATTNGFNYLECKNGFGIENDCARGGEVFVPSCKKCLHHIKSQQNSLCIGRVATSATGKILKYQNPWNCNSWFECLHGIANEYRCQKGMWFSPKQQQCVYDASECRQAFQTAQLSYEILNGMPSGVDATFLWPDGNILLVDKSTFYKFDKNDGSLLPGFPVTIPDQADSRIPSNIDAALSIPGKMTFFFKQDKVWLWGATDGPKYIAEEWNGVPDDLDSAFYWSYNKKVYFFKKEHFYRYDLEKREVDYGYPKPIAAGWPGVSLTVNAAVGLKNGTVYLFNNNKGFVFHPPFCQDDETFLDSSIRDTFVSLLKHE